MSECIAAKWTAALSRSRSVGLLHLRGESGVTDDGVGQLRSLSRSTKRVTIAITSGKICDGSREWGGLWAATGEWRARYIREKTGKEREREPN